VIGEHGESLLQGGAIPPSPSKARVICRNITASRPLASGYSTCGVRNDTDDRDLDDLSGEWFPLSASSNHRNMRNASASIVVGPGVLLSVASRSWSDQPLLHASINFRCFRRGAEPEQGLRGEATNLATLPDRVIALRKHPVLMVDTTECDNLEHDLQSADVCGATEYDPADPCRDM
jgi:hypothetical protein